MGLSDCKRYGRSVQLELEKGDKGEDVLRAQGEIGETLLKTPSTDQPTFSSLGPYSPYIVSRPLYSVQLPTDVPRTNIPPNN